MIKDDDLDEKGAVSCDRSCIGHHTSKDVAVYLDNCFIEDLVGQSNP